MEKILFFLISHRIDICFSDYNRGDVYSRLVSPGG